MLRFAHPQGGFAHVAFATADGKAKGLKLNGTKVGKKVPTAVPKKTQIAY